jgi:lysophospholipase
MGDKLLADSWHLHKKSFSDSTAIRFAEYRNTEQPEGYVVFINGHGEHIEKYAFLPADLLPPSWNLISWDHRGQGGSDGQKMHFDDYDVIGMDALGIVQDVVGVKPYVVVAHSMGGLIALYSVLKGYLKPTKLLLSAPLFGVQNVIPEGVARVMSRTAYQLGYGETYFQEELEKGTSFENNIFTHCPERFAARHQTPYRVEGATYGWIHATFKAIDYAHNKQHLLRLKCDTLVLVGDDERLVDVHKMKAWTELAQECAPGKVQLEVLPNTRHEIFNEEPKSYNAAIARAQSFLF